MKTTCLILTISLLTVVWCGCSGSTPPKVTHTPEVPNLPVAPLATNVSSESLTMTGRLNPETTPTSQIGEPTEDESEPFINPFAAPKDEPLAEIEVMEVKPEPLPSKPGVAPSVRLLGFMHVGAPKALVSIHNKLELMGVGDSLHELEVLNVESPELKLAFHGKELTFNLFPGDATQAGTNATAGSGTSERRANVNYSAPTTDNRHRSHDQLSAHSPAGNATGAHTVSGLHVPARSAEGRGTLERERLTPPRPHGLPSLPSLSGRGRGPSLSDLPALPPISSHLGPNNPFPDLPSMRP